MNLHLMTDSELHPGQGRLFTRVEVFGDCWFSGNPDLPDEPTEMYEYWNQRHLFIGNLAFNGNLVGDETTEL